MVFHIFVTFLQIGTNVLTIMEVASKTVVIPLVDFNVYVTLASNYIKMEKIA
jgi:hypothetical protein